MIWYKDNNDGIIISTRIRLARNLDGIPFPNALRAANKSAEIQAAITQVRDAVKSSEYADEMVYLDLNNADELNKLSLEEEHLISPQLSEGKDKGVILNKDNTVSIMLMEEDHIRLQVIYGGFKLDEAYARANAIDDAIEAGVTYAFDDEFGYLTACPTNTGTGMRASVMLHLPALTYTKNISRIIASATGMGIEIRGMYGEGTDADGCLYQISNCATLGLSEQETIEKLKSIVNQIKDAELKAREQLMSRNKDAIEDMAWRAYGTLKYARSMSSAEAKKLLSQVMMGVNMGIIEVKGELSPLECMIKATPSMISGGKEMSAAQRDSARAEMLRNML